MLEGSRRCRRSLRVYPARLKNLSTRLEVGNPNLQFPYFGVAIEDNLFIRIISVAKSLVEAHEISSGIGETNLDTFSFSSSVSKSSWLLYRN